MERIDRQGYPVCSSVSMLNEIRRIVQDASQQEQPDYHDAFLQVADSLHLELPHSCYVVSQEAA